MRHLYEYFVSIFLKIILISLTLYTIEQEVKVKVRRWNPVSRIEHSTDAGASAGNTGIIRGIPAGSGAQPPSDPGHPYLHGCR
jgi:hypothetical protein